MRKITGLLLVLLLVLVVAPPALAEGDEKSAKIERDPAAMEILEKADAAIKAVDAVRMEMKAEPSGMATNFFSPAEGTSILIGWNNGIPQKFHARIKTKKRGTDETLELTGGGDGDSFFIIDHGTKKAYEDMDPGVFGSNGRTLQSLGMMEYVHDAPFDDELSADMVELQGTEEVAGEACHKVRVVYSGGQGESIWYFSKKDNLPRRRTRVFSGPQGEGAIDAVITKLEIDPKVTADLFKLDLPDGYEQIDDFAP